MTFKDWSFFLFLSVLQRVISLLLVAGIYKRIYRSP